MKALYPFKKIQKQRIFPGFGLSLGYTVVYLSLIVLIPLSAIAFKAFSGGWDKFYSVATEPSVIASYKLTFFSSFIAALINTFFGIIIAWVLVRYSFLSKKIIDAFIDLPFSLPTAVTGITLAALYSKDGLFGQYIEGQWGIKIAFTPNGIFIALIFISLPFVIRTIQPVLEDLEIELEEAAASLGANRWQIFRYIIFPALLPAIFTGFTLAFARSIGEYGSVIFISGNIPMISEITPLMIITKLEQYDYIGATAIAFVMLLISLLLLLMINILQAWSSKKMGKGL